jgi:hypothetical protein
MNLIEESENFVCTTSDKLYDLYFYHDCSHTLEVVSAVKELSIAEKLSPLESEMVIIAACFMILDISKAENHENESVCIVSGF